MNTNKNISTVIADSLLDHYLAFDPNSKTSFVIMAAKNSIIVSGEFTSKACISVPDVLREALYQIENSEIDPNLCGILTIIQELASVGYDLDRFDPLNKGADSSVMVFGYATNETKNFMPTVPDLTRQLTRCQIIADMYINEMNTFCGCDPSKIQRSASYAARHIAKNLVAAGISDEIIVQVAYAVGIAKPVSLFVSTCNKSKIAISDGEISHIIADKIFDMRPKAIEERLKLRNPIYAETALQGHFGQQPLKVLKWFYSKYEGEKKIEVELFTWERLDCVDKIKEVFELK